MDIGRLTAAMAFACLATGFVSAGAAEPPGAPSPELSRDRRIERDLSAARVSEALVEAESATRQFPESALLRRRLGQAKLGMSLVLDERCKRLADDLGFDRTVARALTLLQDGPKLPADT